MTYFEKLNAAERAAIEEYARMEYERIASLSPPSCASDNARADPEAWRHRLCELLAADPKRVRAIVDSAQRGFTLLELSIVLVLIAVIISGGLMMLTAGLQASQYNATVTRMDEIEKALLSYAIANNRIPCPADLGLTSASAYYGYEAGASAGGTGSGECVTGMTPAANFKSASGAEEGGVPARALQLPDDYMYDGWGRKFRYAVDPTYTKAHALPVAAPCGSGFTGDASALTLEDASGTARTTAAMYALISHGANGHGAYTSNGLVLNAGSVNADELTNCHCNSSAASTTYTPTYVEKVPMQDPANALDDFDDIVTFKEPWQIQGLNYPLPAASCGGYLAVATDTTPYVTLYSFNNGALTKLPAPAVPPDGAAYGVNFSPNNALLAVGAAQTSTQNVGLLYTVSASGLTYSSVFATGSNYDLQNIQFSPDSNYIAAGGDFPRFQVNSLSGGNYNTVDTVPNSGSYQFGLAWSTDSSILYGAVNSVGDNHVYAYTHSATTFAQSSSFLSTSYGCQQSPEGLAMSPTGNYLAAGCVNPKSSNSYRLPLVIQNPATSPTLISGPGSGLSTYDGAEIAYGVAWSPDGTMLAVGLYERGMDAYSFNSGTNTFTPATISGSVCPGVGMAVAWSKDSQYLAVTSTGSPNLCVYKRSGTTLTNMNISSTLLPPGNVIGYQNSVAFTH